MSSHFERLGIAQLSVPERMALIDQIWESLAASPELIVLTDSQKAEIDRRIDLHAADPDAGSTWDEVKARLRARRQ